MKNIFLYGFLAEKFGSHFKLDVKSVGEAIRALEANFPGKFFSSIKEGSYVVRRSLIDNGLSEEQLSLRISSNEIHVFPVIQGAGGGNKGKGVATAVLGIALIATAVFLAPAALAGAGFFGANLGASVVGGAGLFSSVTFAQVALWGVGLTLAGVSTFLTPTPKVGSQNYSNRERPEDVASFLFNGATNKTEQGGPIPLVYGRVRVGSTIIAAGLDAERLPT